MHVIFVFFIFLLIVWCIFVVLVHSMGFVLLQTFFFSVSTIKLFCILFNIFHMYYKDLCLLSGLQDRLHIPAPHRAGEAAAQERSGDSCDSDGVHVRRR